MELAYAECGIILRHAMTANNLVIIARSFKSIVTEGNPLGRSKTAMGKVEEQINISNSLTEKSTVQMISFVKFI